MNNLISDLNIAKMIRLLKKDQGNSRGTFVAQTFDGVAG
jgi:hypothetical protein